MINVKLTGQFMKLAPEGSEKGVFTTEYKAGTTLSSLLTQLGVESVGVNYTVLVNNLRKAKDYTLEDADSITVIPLLSGG
jgi:molybdopterin converting factor small subunit